MGVPETGELAGQFWVVTGGNRGIGGATALKLAERGALVGATATNEEGVQMADELLAPYGGFGHQLRFEQGLDDEFYADTVKAMVLEAEARFAGTVHEGGKVAIKGLVNNAGATDNKNFASFRANDWRNQLETNVVGPVLTTNAAYRYMRKEGGSVTWVGSAAKHGHKGQAPYAGAKSALEGISATMAVDLAGSNIRSNVVRLGLVDTRMTRGDLSPEQFEEIEKQVPDGRAYTPVEAADVIVRVATDPNLNGEVVVYDGGLSDKLAQSH